MSVGSMAQLALLGQLHVVVVYGEPLGLATMRSNQAGKRKG